MPLQHDPRVDLARTRTMAEVVDRIALPVKPKGFVEVPGPCPGCGGKDRFSVNVKKGVWICRQCKPKGGDPIALVMLVKDCTFMEAVEFLEGSRDVEIDPAEIERREKAAAAAKEKAERESARYRAWARADAVRIWLAAAPFRGTQAEDYLEFRVPDFGALALAFKCFRFLPMHAYTKKIGKRNVTLHSGPALISAVQGRDGTLQAVHQTWIDLDAPKGKAVILHPDTGKTMPAKMVRGSKKGGAIRLTGTACTSRLVMGEGVETTLSALVADAALGASYWAGVDLGNMSGIRMGGKFSSDPDLSDELAFVPPANVTCQIFIQDGDSEPKQTRAQLVSGLRRAMQVNPALTGHIAPVGEGVDLNDILKGQEQ